MKNAWLFVLLVSQALQAQEANWIQTTEQDPARVVQDELVIPRVTVDFGPGEYTDVRMRVTDNDQWRVVAATPAADGLRAIRYGRYAGMCGGYCVEELTLTPSEVGFDKHGWTHLPPAITMRGAMAESDWREWGEQVDFPLFSSLPDTIGCPDCVDQGGEFVEIRWGNQTKRIDFNGSIDSRVDGLTQALQTLFETQRSQLAEYAQN